MEKTFVIGDIHGCNNELELLIERLPLQEGDTIIFLGDYIDRGPDSKNVINTIIKLGKKYNLVTLMGNHEQMFLDFFYNRNTPEANAFLYNGGTSTLASYSNPDGDFEFPQKHINFLNSLKLFHELEDYAFVHAGLPPLPISEIRNNLDGHFEELLWIREDFIKSNYSWEKTIVHGHTPVVHPTITPKRINLDTGCVYDGKLSAIELPERILYSVPRIVNKNLIVDVPTTGKRRSTRYVVVLPVAVELDGNSIIFETINYSDHGMLMYSMAVDTYAFATNQIIEGVIGSPKNQASFSARIVRIEKKAMGFFVALEFIKKPQNNGPL